MRRYFAASRVSIREPITDYVILTGYYRGKWYLSPITNTLYPTTYFKHFMVGLTREIQFTRPPYDISGCNERGELFT